MIGQVLKKQSSLQRKVQRNDDYLNPKSEPYEISARFYRALQAKAISLEDDAQKDECFAASLENPGHLHRQNLLIQAQRDKAQRLRNFLAEARVCIA
jgi:hypothetical protein